MEVSLMIRMALFVAAVAVAMVTGTPAGRAADVPQIVIGPTTIDISIGHAGISSIPLGMGYWREEGLDVKVIGITNSTVAMQQLTAGNVTCASITADSSLHARAKGVPAKAVYTYAREPITRIVTLKSSGITKLEQLKGKKIGVMSMADGSVFIVRHAASDIGLEPMKDFPFVGVGTGAQAALALQRGDVQVWVGWDTVVASAENRGMEFSLLRPAYFDKMLGNAILCREDFIKQYPEAVGKLLRGISKATVFGLANPEAVIRNHWKMYPGTKPQGTDESKMMAESLRIFNSRFDGLKLRPGQARWGENVLGEWAGIATIAKQSGQLPDSFDPGTVYTNDFVDAANSFDRAAVVKQAKDSKW
jgi:NitT/TauT family transport system substrate-binding protein